MTVLVVGAGPTGLTAALSLASEGRMVRIVEAREDASNLSRAVGILPAAMEVFDALGAGDAIRAEALRPTRVAVSRAGKPLGELDFADIREKGHEILALGQHRTEALLRAALSARGVEVEYGRGLTTLSQDADGVEVVLAEGTRLRATHIIGADGAQSTVRRQCRIGYPGHDIARAWSIADVEVTHGFDAQTFRADLGTPETGVTVAIPFAEHRVRIVAAREDALAGLPFDFGIGEVHRASSFHIPVRQAERYVLGRVLLAGDAAHSHSPVGGRGMNLGIVDASAAAHAIALNSPEAYERARHAAGAQVITQTERARRIVTSGSPAVAAGARIMLAAMGLSRGARAAAFARLIRL